MFLQAVSEKEKKPFNKWLLTKELSER